MATHPDDPHAHNPGDEEQPHGSPAAGEHAEGQHAEGEQGKAPKHTKLPGQPGKPTMIQRDEDGTSPSPSYPNMSLEDRDEEVPVLGEAEGEGASDILTLEPVAEETEMIPPTAPPSGAEEIPVLEAVPDDVTVSQPVSDVAEAQPVSDVAEAEPVSDVTDAEAIFDEMEVEPTSDVAEAQPVDVTGADVPGAEVTGAEHVLGDDLTHPEPARAAEAAGSDVFAMAEPGSGAEAVLGDEPLDRGSRPSARVESPIRAEPDDDDVLNLEGEASAAPGRKNRGKRDDLDATEEVLAGEPTGRGSSAVTWNEIGEDSGAVVKPADDETLAFEAADEGSDDSLLGAADLVMHPEDSSSAVNLGELPGKAKSASGIDQVAEALESGVNLDDEAPLSPVHGTPSVEFDDILTDSAESMPALKKSSAKKPRADDDIEPLDPTDDDLKTVGKGKKRKRKSGVDLVDEGPVPIAGDEEEADEAEAVAVPTDDEAEAVAVPTDDDEAVAAAVDDKGESTDKETDEIPVSKKKKGRATADDEEAAPSKARGKTQPQTAPAGGPSCLGRLVGAGFFTLLGIILLGGGLAVVQFVSPGLVDEYYHQVPGVPKPAKTVQQQQQPIATPTERAYKSLAAGEYDQVALDLKDETDPPAVAVRGEAAWLKYAKSKLDAKQALKETDKEVQDAINDLRTGKNDRRADEILRILHEPEAQAQLAQAKASMDTLSKMLAKAQTDRKQVDALVNDIGAVLVGAKVIDDPDQVSADSVRKMVKELGDARTTVAGVNKALLDAKIKATGPKGVAELLAAKSDSENKLNDVNKALADANVKDPGAKGVQEVLATWAKLQKDRNELDAVAKAAYEELVKAKVAPVGGDPRKGLAEGAKLAREKGESPLALPLAHLGSALAGLGKGVGQLVANSTDASLLAADLALLRAREPFIQTPAQKMDLYAALLQDRSRQNPKELGAIMREADWVLTREAKVSPQDRAKALYVTGLALRNEGQFDAARKALDGAVKHAGAKNAPWEKQAKAALAELTNPQAYYLPQIERLAAAGNLKSALAESDQALKALPGNGKLLAERGRLRLESLRGKGKLSVEAQKQIRNDAEAAVKSPGGAAEGAYLLGLLEEDLGQYAKAETHLRSALKAHKGSEVAAARYRVALARVLLQDRPAAAAPAPAAQPQDEKKDGAESADPAEPAAPGKQPVSAIHPVSALLLTVVIGAQPPDEQEPEHENPETAKRLREAIDLAKQLATSKDAKVRDQGYALLGEAAGKAGTQLSSTTCLELSKALVKEPDPKIRGTGLMLLGQGLVKQGKRTEGLKEYARGLELLSPGLASHEIARMVEEHPAFQHPDAANKPNPLLAEKFFGNGLHLYWARQYPAAEAQFKLAIDYFNQDARYSYFLGLAQLAQKSKLKRDQAYFSFERGAQLEAQGRPTIADINTSLERVQGEVRQLLNAFRFRGLAAAAGQ
jgi:hypothetical protein